MSPASACAGGKERSVVQFERVDVFRSLYLSTSCPPLSSHLILKEPCLLIKLHCKVVAARTIIATGTTARLLRHVTFQNTRAFLPQPLPLCEAIATASTATAQKKYQRSCNIESIPHLATSLVSPHAARAPCPTQTCIPNSRRPSSSSPLPASTSAITAQ